MTVLFSAPSSSPRKGDCLELWYIPSSSHQMDGGLSLLPRVFLSSVQRSPGLWQLVKPFQSLLNLQAVAPANQLAHQLMFSSPISRNLQLSLTSNWSFYFLGWKVKLGTIKMPLCLCPFAHDRKATNFPTKKLVVSVSHFSKINFPLSSSFSSSPHPSWMLILVSSVTCWVTLVS